MMIQPIMAMVWDYVRDYWDDSYAETLLGYHPVQLCIIFVTNCVERETEERHFFPLATRDFSILMQIDVGLWADDPSLGPVNYQFGTPQCKSTYQW